MKKKKEWITKEQKREAKMDDRGIVDLIQVKEHFFHGFNQWIDELLDPRNESYTFYTQTDLIYLGILKNICAVESMRQMNEKFNEKECIQTLAFLSQNEELEELPDYTTLNYYLEKLSPKCLSELRAKMIRHLIRSKVFHKNRLLNKYWVVILDGTEFIENENVSKQDCEQNAAKRLLSRKKEYPRLPMCILGDGLYCVEPLMKMCSDND